MNAQLPSVPTVMISWVSCHDPAHEIHRRCTWVGKTRQVVLTGLPACFSANCPSAFELPPGTKVHEVPDDVNGLDLALQLGGVLFTVLCSSELAPQRDLRSS